MRASKYSPRTKREGDTYTILNASAQDLLSEITADIKAKVPLEIQTRYVLEQQPCLVVIGGRPFSVFVALLSSGIGIG